MARRWNWINNGMYIIVGGKYKSFLTLSRARSSSRRLSHSHNFYLFHMCVTHSSIIFIPWIVTHTHTHTRQHSPLIFQKAFYVQFSTALANNFEYKVGKFHQIYFCIIYSVACRWRCKCMYLLSKVQNVESQIKFQRIASRQHFRWFGVRYIAQCTCYAGKMLTFFMRFWLVQKCESQSHYSHRICIMVNILLCILWLRSPIELIAGILINP